MESPATALWLSFQLLGEHVPAEGNAALQGHCREIGTLPALCLGPGAQRGDEPRNAGAHSPQKSEIRSNGLDPTAIFRAVRAELQKLYNPGKIVTARRVLNPRNILHFGRKRVLDRSRDEGAA